MSKKQTKSASKKTQAKTKAAKARGGAKQAATTKQARTTSASTTGVARATRAAGTSRLPPAGTVIQKLDRYGAVRCECAVEEAGIRYKGRVFRSLSGAAMAAATDLGLTNKTQNGFTFWGLTKPARKLADPVDALVKSFGRYRGVAELVMAGATDQNRAQLRGVLQEQGLVIESLLGQAAS